LAPLVTALPARDVLMIAGGMALLAAILLLLLRLPGPAIIREVCDGDGRDR
jgi:hypothetical protein